MSFIFLILRKIKNRNIIYLKKIFVKEREYISIKRLNIISIILNTEFVKNLLHKFKEDSDKFDKEFLNATKDVKDMNVNEDQIIKQNRTLTKTEVISLILSMKSNRSQVYTALNSYWPLYLTGGLFGSIIIFVAIFFRDSKANPAPLIIFLIGSLICMLFWFSVFYSEKKSGKHVDMIKRNIVHGFYIFLFTEILCFLALFWTFFHSTLSASIHIGIFNPGEGVVNFYVSDSYLLKKHWDIYCYHTWGTPGYYHMSNVYALFEKELWQYKKVKVHTNLFDSGILVNPWGLPVVNTLILLTSAAILNAGHCYLTLSKFFKSLICLFITMFFGVLFVICQFIEYFKCSMSFNDGIFAACFLGTTGLHGIHVMLGIFALYMCSMNFLNKAYTPNFHQTFYFSIFYWHFVDVVWILVWLCIYLWPGSYFFTKNYVGCCDYNFFIYNLNTNYFMNIVDYNSVFNSFSLDESIYDKKKFINRKVKNLWTYSKFYQMKLNMVSVFDDIAIIINYRNLRIKLDSITYLSELNENYSSIIENYKLLNFNKFKTDIEFICWFRTEIHYELENIVYCPLFEDLKNKIYRISAYLILRRLENGFITWVYCKFLFSPWYWFYIR